ncbi:hypothetical protein M409DRAFT_17651 [Zasmidium cellare ATCC 36951]|uniref:C2H2-type domain-containing protein n=1 Tax=Zasmidium cellare ATCC 36951 TaxID=1080233 RepID=A0A6A6D1V5_ZASCE|nr:uncharacterized protein M409DRAFT_17651 [Zasmidium cellare ATCC 36951]KAF2172418.1 hypothetical protein M409DRAFT_17651 [Zasmidium cellare ATCC 36951]
MPADRSSKFSDELIAHLEEYGVAICKKCQFAIQPSALPSHLLRHQIYRNERRELLQRLSKLKLPEPDNVSLPDSNSDPLPHLNVHRGFKCEQLGCEHACVSSKRMSQHWSEQHDEHDSRNVKARSAYLQTFFRGNKIRYFEVNGPGETLAMPSSSKDNDASNTSLSPPSGTEPVSSISKSPSDEVTPLIDESVIPLTLDMQTLQYFHHYTVNTSLTLRRSMTESETFWKVDIPRQAFRYPFLMYAILGLSAMHHAMQSIDELQTCQSHYEEAMQYQNAALVDFRSAMRMPDAENSTALIAFGRFFGVQRCVQHQLEWLLSMSTSSDENDMSKLLEFFFLLRGGHEMLLTLQHLLPRHSDLILSQEVVASLRELEDHETVSDAQLANIPNDMRERFASLPAKVAPLIAAQPFPEASLDDLQPAVNALTTAASLSFASDDVRNIWDGIEGWLRILPDQYIHMLSGAQPGALVIFAHWLMLTKRLEDHYWFAKGSATRLHSIVMANLPDDEWRALVVDLP